jgi:hypothetical protein
MTAVPPAAPAPGGPALLAAGAPPGAFPAAPNFQIIAQSLNALSQQVGLMQNLPIVGIGQQVNQILNLVLQMQAQIQTS